MFFVSEEFLRKNTTAGDIKSTLGEVVAPGDTLFPDEQSHKAQRRDEVREKQDQGS